MIKNILGALIFSLAVKLSLIGLNLMDRETRIKISNTIDNEIHKPKHA